MAAFERLRVGEISAEIHSLRVRVVFVLFHYEKLVQEETIKFFLVIIMLLLLVALYSKKAHENCFHADTMYSSTKYNYNSYFMTTVVVFFS